MVLVLVLSLREANRLKRNFEYREHWVNPREPGLGRPRRAPDHPWTSQSTLLDSWAILCAHSFRSKAEV